MAQEYTPEQALAALDQIIQSLNFPRSTHLELIRAVALLQHIIEEHKQMTKASPKLKVEK